MVLATTIDRDRLVAAPSDMNPEQRHQTGDELVRLLGLDDVAGMALRDKLASGKSYVILARGITPTLAGQIRDGVTAKRLFGISLEPEPVRVYPQSGGAPRTSLAAHVLGFVNASGRGQYGLEQAYDSMLSGDPRRCRSDPDAPGGRSIGRS